MKTITLTPTEAREIMPTAAALLADTGVTILGAIQIDTPEIDCWPSADDLADAAMTALGGRIGDSEPDNDGETVTWLVVR